MAEELNYTIPQLNNGVKYTDPKAGDLMVIHDFTEGVDKPIDISFLLPASPSTSYKWISNFDYAAGAIVDYNGKWWESLVGSNEGNVPTEGGGFWTEVSKSASGFVKYTPGVFSQNEVYTLNEVDGFLQLFELNPAVARPFNSVNFNKELSEGKWNFASERGYIGIQKAAHGFAVNNVLTFKGDGWNKFAPGDRKLAIVKTVVDSNGVIAVVIGDRVKAFSGLIPGQVYYAQPDATIGIAITTDPVFIAISETEVILLYSSSSSEETPPDPDDVYGSEYGLEYHP